MSDEIAREAREIVALLTECVDRNQTAISTSQDRHSRTPYGVRG